MTANYSEAGTILKRTFSKKQFIIITYVHGGTPLCRCDHVMGQLKGLRHLYDVVKGQIRGFNPLGIAAIVYESLLTSVLLNRLPQELHLVVS